MKNTEDLRTKWEYRGFLLVAIPAVTAFILVEKLFSKLGLWEKEPDDVVFRMDIAWRNENKNRRKSTVCDED